MKKIIIIIIFFLLVQFANLAKFISVIFHSKWLKLDHLTNGFALLFMRF